MKYSEKAIKEAKEVIFKYKTIEARANALVGAGFTVGERSMGSGGVGQVKTTKTEVRLQATSGKGPRNYAKCVIFNK